MIRQINDNGMPLISGLDVFVAFPIFGEEILSLNNSFTTNTLPRKTPAIQSVLTNYATEVVGTAGLPIFKNSNWYTYGTNGTAYPDVGENVPQSNSNVIRIHAVVSESISSHSGIFQELGRLIPENEYRININLGAGSTVGALAVSTLYNIQSSTGNTLTQSHIQTATLDGGHQETSLVFGFKAHSPGDILFLDYSSTINGGFIDISSISVKEKSEYRVPVIVGSSTVLAKQYNLSIPPDEGEIV